MNSCHAIAIYAAVVTGCVFWILAMLWRARADAREFDRKWKDRVQSEIQKVRRDYANKTMEEIADALGSALDVR